MTNSEKQMREALEWYGENARLARLIHSEGDAGRHALAADGGKRARAALSTDDASAGGEKATVADSLLLHWTGTGEAWVDVWSDGKIIAVVPLTNDEVHAQAGQWSQLCNERGLLSSGDVRRDPNEDVLTWLDSAHNATRDQAVGLCKWAAEEIRELRATPPQPAPTVQEAATARYPTDADLDDACMSMRHDFGLLSHPDQNALRREALDWLRCWRRALSQQEEGGENG